MVQILLPAAYGLADHEAHDPGRFGQQDRSFSVTTNSEGEFSHDLGHRVYHRNVWLFPPLGGFPRYPPAPFLLVRVPSFPGEYYAIQTSNGKFKVLSTGGAELSLEQAHLFELSATSESGSADEERWTTGVIDLRFTIR